MSMRKFFCLIMPGLLALSLFHLSIALAARDQVIQIKGTGPFTLGSMNLTIDSNTLSSILAAGGNAGNYQQGLNVNGQLLYMTTLLANPNDTFTFNVNVPNDAATYGIVAGQTLTYVGIVVYPTTSSNSRSNATIFGNDTLPHMQSAGEAPIFADAAAKYPLIVFSHGDGDRPDEVTNLRIVTEIASHGYIVVSLYHGDNRFNTLSAERFNLRPLAVKNSIDAITSHPAFGNHINLSQIGGVGVSFGGATMLALIGGKTLSANLATTFDFTPKTTTTDSRLKATAGVVPYLGDTLFPFFGNGGNGASSVAQPYMAISGTADTTVPISKVRETLTSIPGAKYLIELEGEGHSFSATALNEALTWVITYLDALVKQEPSARNTLLNASSVSGGVNDSVTVVTDISVFNSQSDCLFNWAEGNYASLFAPAGATSNTLAPYYYRYYSQTNSYLGTSPVENHLYYIGPDSGNTLYDVGALSTWLTRASCQ